jgi:hypothetical protein
MLAGPFEKKQISQSSMLDVADKEYSRRANKMQT